MADEQKQEEQQSSEPAKKKPPIMVLAVVAVLMVVEGLAVFLFVSMTSGGNDAGASEIQGLEQAELDATSEIMLIDGQFQNLTTGRPWTWEVEIQLKVKTDNQSHVEQVLERRNAEIREAVSLLFSKAQHRHLKEAGRETITRQLTALVNEIFGKDAEGKPRVERVIVPRCQGYDASY